MSPQNTVETPEIQITENHVPFNFDLEMSQIVELNDEAQSSINLEDDPENEIVEDVVEPQEKTEAVIKKRNPKKLKWDIDRKNKKNQSII